MGALIAYFSRRGENYVSGKLKELTRRWRQVCSSS